jgi:lipopolysaccharide transport system permease protein
MVLHLVRDSDGRPIAVRIRFPEIGVSGRVRPIATRVGRRLSLAWRRSRAAAIALGDAMRRCLPQFELRRDSKGRPDAIRIAPPSLDIRQRITAFAAMIGRRIPRAPARVVWVFTLIRYGVLYALPEVELRRDPIGRPAAVMFRFGGRVAAVPALPRATGTTTVVVPLEWFHEPRGLGLISSAAEVWHYRRFISFLGAKSFRKLYARTMLGWFWVFAAPILPILLNVFVFGALIGVTSEGIPYFLFLMIGNLAWDLFASALMWSTRGLEMHRKVLDRVYVPRIILPVATMTPALFNFLINFTATVFVILYYWAKDKTPYVSLGVNSIWSIAAIAMILTLVLGISLFTSVWGEKARDARLVIGNVTALLFLVTPVLYPTSQVPLKYQKWLALNPMASFVEAFKYGIFGTHPPDPLRFAIAAVSAIVLLSFGLLFFTWRSDVEEMAVA